MTRSQLLERWILDPSSRTYHEWVEREAAHIDALIEEVARERETMHVLALRMDDARDAELRRVAEQAAMVERRLREVPPEYRNTENDTFLLEDVWRTRADIHKRPPFWWGYEHMPTMLSRYDLARLNMGQSSSVWPGRSFGYPYQVNRGY